MLSLALVIWKPQGRMASMHAIFFKRFWHLLEDDLVAEVLGAVQNAAIPTGWNDTTIIMIPKVDNPDKVTQFRPISLCNVVYKIISKIISLRLKSLLPEIISYHRVDLLQTINVYGMKCVRAWSEMV